MSTTERAKAILDEMKQTDWTRKGLLSELARKYGIAEQSVSGIRNRAIFRGELVRPSKEEVED